MKIEKVKISELVEDPANVRKHSERNIDFLKGALTKFGQQKPVVVGDRNVVIAGNGLYRAAKALGWTEIEIVRTNLKGIDATGYALADNRLAETSEWDYEGLGKLMKSLQEEDYNLQSLGWEDYEINAFLNTEDPLGDINDPAAGDGPDDLPEPEVSGEDDRLGRFILTYESDEDKAFLIELLGIRGDLVVYSTDQIRKERKERGISDV